MKLTEEQIEEFNEKVKPLMKYLSNNKVFHPHITITINSTKAELVEGVIGFTSHEFIED